MRIVFIADARSPIARNWIGYYTDRGHDVHVISTYPCEPNVLPGVSLIEVPIAFAGLSKVRHDGTIGDAKRRSPLTPVLASLRSGPGAKWVRAVRYVTAPLELNRHVGKIRSIIKRAAPDIVHAMRIPFEGILAAKARPAGPPLLISVWGNDFTLYAQTGKLAGYYTRRAMLAADALHCDCERDLHLSKDWGFDSTKPAIVLPGAGGIQTEVFGQQVSVTELRESLQIPASALVVINPRGFRDYVRNDVFFQSLPGVLKKHPNVIFICPAMQGNAVAEGWAERLGVARSVRLLPPVTREQMAGLFRMSAITVSPSLHDGTPNTLLEAMASGCFPVAGNIESVQEWIEDGVNGILFDPRDPAALSHAVSRALADMALRERAGEYNLRLIERKAEYGKVMAASEVFYRKVIAQAGRG